MFDMMNATQLVSDRDDIIISIWCLVLGVYVQSVKRLKYLNK